MDTQETAHDSLETWTAALQAICGHFETRTALDPSLFIGRIALASHAGVEVAHLKTNAGLISRPSHRPDHDNDQHCFLVSQRSGRARIAQDDLSILLEPGELLLMDSVGSCSITPIGLIEHASLPLPRSLVTRKLGQRPFGRISACRASGRMLHLMVNQLCRRTLTSAAEAEADALRDALLQLLPAALAPDDAPEANPEALPGDSLLEYARQLIDESLGQASLDPDALARRMKISVRRLYRLFEAENDSVCRYIQHRRLQRCAQDLSDPALKSHSITTIAFKWGFVDSAHFSRSFKKHYALAPREYRQRALA